MGMPEKSESPFLNTDDPIAAQVKATLKILEEIPTTSSKRSDNTRELNAVDEVRKERINYLVQIAREQAERKKDPTEIINAVLEHVDLLATSDALEYYLQFARIQHSFGSNLVPLFDGALGVADTEENQCEKALDYARIGKTQFECGLDTASLDTFKQARELIDAGQKEIRTSGERNIGYLGEIEVTGIVSEIVRIMLAVGNVEEARAVIDTVGEDFRHLAVSGLGEV